MSASYEHFMPIVNKNAIAITKKNDEHKQKHLNMLNTKQLMASLKTNSLLIFLPFIIL